MISRYSLFPYRWGYAQQKLRLSQTNPYEEALQTYCVRFSSFLSPESKTVLLCLLLGYDTHFIRTRIAWISFLVQPSNFQVGILY